MVNNKAKGGFFTRAQNLKNVFNLEILHSKKDQSSSLNGLDVKVANPIGENAAKIEKTLALAKINLHQVKIKKFAAVHTVHYFFCFAFILNSNHPL